MKEIEQLKDLFESLGEIEQLNEYFFQRGDPLSEVVNFLNLFMDTENNPFPDQPKWEPIRNKYALIANKLEKAINRSDIIMNDEMVRALENAYYEGGDLYDELANAIAYFPEMYNKQIEILMSIIKGTFDSGLGESQL